MEAAHACEDADLRRLANQVDELIVDCHSDASENWQEIDLVDEPDEIDEIAEGAQPRHPDDKIAEDQTPRKKLNYHAITYCALSLENYRKPKRWTAIPACRQPRREECSCRHRSRSD